METQAKLELFRNRPNFKKGRDVAVLLENYAAILVR